MLNEIVTVIKNIYIYFHKPCHTLTCTVIWNAVFCLFWHTNIILFDYFTAGSITLFLAQVWHKLHIWMNILIFDNLCNFRYYSYSTIITYKYQNVKPNQEPSKPQLLCRSRLMCHEHTCGIKSPFLLWTICSCWIGFK